MADNLHKVILKVKTIAAWASYYGKNYDIYYHDDQVQNLRNIEDVALEIIKLLEEVE